MKRKTLTLTLSLLACFALIGVGFASWIITATTTKSMEGNITVDTVTDNRLAIEAEWVDANGNSLGTNPTIYYGAHASDTVTWLINSDSNSKKESLFAYLKVTVSRRSGNEAIDWSKVNLTAVMDSNDTYTSYQNAGYFGALPQAEKQSKLNPSDEDEQEQNGVYYFVFEFKWGSSFEGKNPLTYYKDIEEPTEEQLNDAYTALNAINTINTTPEGKKSIKFTLTISASLSN